MSLNKMQNNINHVGLVLDASQSMSIHKSEVIRVVDGLISHLARRSQEMDQETRITVYTFNHNVECVIYDKDVLRLPSIAKHYHPSGMTALVDATMQAKTDLSKTPELYGDHAFLVYVITDGQENRSTKYSFTSLINTLSSLPDNWTVATLVPDEHAKRYAQSTGFPTENIAIWETTSEQGIEEVGEVIRNATESFMRSRVLGVRSSKNLFSTDINAVNKDTLKQAKLKPIPKDTYTVIEVKQDGTIRETVEAAGFTYVLGNAFYQLTKTEVIQGQKLVAVRNKHSGRFHMGENARDVLGLPKGMDARVKPDGNKEFDVFIQSTSVNRKLHARTRLLYIH